LGGPEFSVGIGSLSRVEALSASLCCSGLSGRVVAGVLRGFARFSYESVRLRFRRLRKAFPRPIRKRRSLVVDETKLKLREEHLSVWAAVDVKTKEVLACRVSWTRNMMQAEAFLGRSWGPARTSLSSWSIRDHGTQKP